MKFHSLLLTALTALSLTLGGCSNDDTIKNPDGDGDGQKITLNIGVASRADDGASRGTDGQYFDSGLPGENAVDNAVIIIYDRPINAPNASDGKIVKSIYVEALGDYVPSNFPTDAEYFDPYSSFYPQSDVLNTISVGKVNISKYYTKTVKIKPDDATLEVGKRYYATAICNFGNIAGEFAPKESLDKLRNYIYEGKLYEVKTPAYAESIENTKGSEGIRAYTKFRMSGINETSFKWEQNSGKEVKLGDFMVQRLAARVDVMFGEATTEFLNQSSYFSDQDIKLAVYTLNENTGKLEINPSYDFYLTDLEIVNNVETGDKTDLRNLNNQHSYTYLIERSTKNDPSKDLEKAQSSAVYFDNEGWTSSNHRVATKYVLSPSGKTYQPKYSLHSVAGYRSLPDLIKAGAFYNDNDDSYYVNKSKSYVVGYLGESTNSSNYTALRVKGWTKALPSQIFSGSRAVPTGYTELVGVIPIFHSQDSQVMRYGVVRNTIYRIRIKIVAMDNKIFFEYYYVTPDGTIQKPYTASGFSPEVDECSPKEGETVIIPND